MVGIQAHIALGSTLQKSSVYLGLKNPIDRKTFLDSIGFLESSLQESCTKYLKAANTTLDKTWYPLKFVKKHSDIGKLFRSSKESAETKALARMLLNKSSSVVFVSQRDDGNKRTLYRILTEDNSPYLANLFYVHPL
jgi:hypothetical protein